MTKAATSATTSATTADLRTLFGLDAPLAPPPEVADMSRVAEARFFAAALDVARTRALAASIRAARDFALGASRCGMQRDEIVDSLSEGWPELGVTGVSVEGEGTLLVIEAA